MSYNVQGIPVLSDNYAWLVTCPEGQRVLIDPGSAEECAKVLADGHLDWILLTHHHADHVGGTDALRKRYGARVIGAEAPAMPRLDTIIRGGETLELAGLTVQVLATPGHAVGHVSYVVPQVPALFCGDVLFSAGCGRLLEGTAAELFASIGQFEALPGETWVCAGHEYTESNVRFARRVDPENAALEAYEAEVLRLRAEGHATLPVRLVSERLILLCAQKRLRNLLRYGGLKM
ncbi:hydroxyacylglutathione hydrolase [Neokomagataea anthophila]|uniref:hydroxyacylglutathione hydrolase n=1 Tax=Neokomagataea anthophila TaxID=2826925 RepID=UPI0031FDDA61